MFYRLGSLQKQHQLNMKLSGVLGLSHSTQNPTVSVCVCVKTGTCKCLPACVCTCGDLCICKCVLGAGGYSEDIVRASGSFSRVGVWKRSKDVTLQLAQDRTDGLLTLTALPLCLCVWVCLCVCVEKTDRVNHIQRIFTCTAKGWPPHCQFSSVA